MELLTSPTNIRLNRDLSANVKDSKINPHIMDAQMSDLRPLLGDDLFYKILATPLDFEDLLEPKTFDTLDGQTSYSFGLKRVIEEFAYARYKFDSSDISTPFGLQQKQNENAVATTIERAKELYTEQRKMAVTYWLSVERYLNNNRETYPTFRNYGKETTGNKTTYVTRNLWL